MNEMQITSAVYFKPFPTSPQHTAIKATIDGQELFVPLDPNNRHYAAILKAVEEGTLVIQEATA